PFADFYRGLAGIAVVDWLFMAGLLGIGLALILGIGMRIAAVAGALLLVLMWTAALWPETNPFMDDHLVYAGLLIGLALARAEDTLGLGRGWGGLAVAARHPRLTQHEWGRSRSRPSAAARPGAFDRRSGRTRRGRRVGPSRTRRRSRPRGSPLRRAAASRPRPAGARAARCPRWGRSPGSPVRGRGRRSGVRSRRSPAWS